MTETEKLRNMPLVDGPGLPAGSRDPVVGAELSTSPHRTERPKVVYAASRLELFTRDVMSRARPELPQGAKSPVAQALDEFDALRSDNMLMADELRACAIERDVAESEAKALRKSLLEVSARADRNSKALGVLRTEMLVAGRIIIELIEKVDRELDERPVEVQAFAPKAKV